MINLTNENITEGLYIPSIEAKWLYKENMATGNYEVDPEFLDRLLGGKIDYSYELVENVFLTENLDVREYRGKLYTLDIVNVRYSEVYKEITDGETGSSTRTKELRDWTYTEGFMMNDNHYSNWKRSTGKARVGENLFLVSDLVEKCLSWARMGLVFTGDVDIASVRAYESLPLSSIVGTIEIDPESILVIDDYDSVFPWDMSKTKLVDGRLVTETGTVTESNSIWDGQGLMDESVFADNALINGQAFALLRNRYMKCATFSTNMEQFFRDYCEAHGEDYGSFTIEDMYGKEMLVKDIKLITTPSSIKIEKFAKEVREQEGYDYDNSWLDYWLDHAGTTYGVCEVDEPSRYEDGKYNRLSYQMVNTIPFTRGEVTELADRDKKHIMRLKNDLDYFVEEANLHANEVHEPNDMGEDGLVEGNVIDVIGAFSEMLKTNRDFHKTQVFKDYRRNFISSMVKELRQGKVKVEGDYATLVGNPIEMLYATVGQFSGEAMALDSNQIACPHFADGESVVGFRNPHVCVGNIANLVNRREEQIEKYMNLSDNVVVVNSIEYPLLTLLQGADFDSDTMLLTNNSTIVGASSRVDHSVTPIPTNAIENSGKNNAELTGQNMADIDHTVSQNYIGEDVNLSQQVNSWMNHQEHNGELEEEQFISYYQDVSKCSSISCVEIDKAKRQFADLDVPAELRMVRASIPTVSESDNRALKARFFKYVGDNEAQSMKAKNNKKHREMLDEATILMYATEKGIDVADVDKKSKEVKKLIKKNAKAQKKWEEQEYVYLDTPMDWLQEEVDGLPNADRVSTLQVIQLVKRMKNKPNAKVVREAVRIIKRANDSINGCRADRTLDYAQRRDNIEWFRNEAVRELQAMNIGKGDMRGAMGEVMNSVRRNGKVNKKTGMENIALDLLFRAYGTGLLTMFVGK